MKVDVEVVVKNAKILYASVMILKPLQIIKNAKSLSLKSLESVIMIAQTMILNVWVHAIGIIMKILRSVPAWKVSTFSKISKLILESISCKTCRGYAENFLQFSLTLYTYTLKFPQKVEIITKCSFVQISNSSVYFILLIYVSF